MTNVEGVLARAKQFTFVREIGGPNRGPWVEAIQRVGGGKPGDAWCACFVGFVLSLWYDGKPPLKMTAGCDEMLADCAKRGFIVAAPQPGDLFFLMRSPTDAYHVGFVTGVAKDRFGTIEGNTNDDGSADGIGVFERSRPRKGAYQFARYV